MRCRREESGPGRGVKDAWPPILSGSAGRDIFKDGLRETEDVPIGTEVGRCFAIVCSGKLSLESRGGIVACGEARTWGMVSLLAWRRLGVDRERIHGGGSNSFGNEF